MITGRTIGLQMGMSTSMRCTCCEAGPNPTDSEDNSSHEAVAWRSFAETQLAGSHTDPV